MKTGRFTGNRKVEIEEKPVPEIGPDEVLVRVKACGLCGSERPHYEEGFHQHQGHESSGLVEKAGENTHLKKGDRVVLYLTLFCGTCEMCRRGETTLCETYYPDKENMGWSFPGAFAEYVKVPAANALPLDDSLSFDQGVLLLDTLGTPFHGLRLADVRKNDSVLVFGCGVVGLGTISVLNSLGVEHIYAADINPLRLKKAEELGARSINAQETDVVEYMRKATNTGVDLTVEAIGKPATLQASVLATKPQGKVLMLGEQPDQFSIDINLQMRLRDQIFIRSWYFPVREYYENVALMKSGFFGNHEKLISDTYPLTRLQEAADAFYGGETLKVIVEP